MLLCGCVGWSTTVVQIDMSVVSLESTREVVRIKWALLFFLHYFVADFNGLDCSTCIRRRSVICNGGEMCQQPWSGLYIFAVCKWIWRPQFKSHWLRFVFLPFIFKLFFVHMADKLAQITWKGRIFELLVWLHLKHHHDMEVVVHLIENHRLLFLVYLTFYA